jgi:hypothetical protein
MLIKPKIKHHSMKIEGVTDQYTSYAPPPGQEVQGTQGTARDIFHTSLMHIRDGTDTVENQRSPLTKINLYTSIKSIEISRGNY